MSNVKDRCGGDQIIAKTGVGETNGEVIPVKISSSSMPSKRYRMKKADYEKIVQYLEDPEHFATLHGARKVEGRVVPKSTAFAAMAVHLTQEGFPPMTGTIIRKKFERYLEGYKKARELLNDTGGAGLTESEIQSGMTLEAKLDAKCPFFHRMHALFGCGSDTGLPAFQFCSQSNSLRSDDKTQTKLLCQTKREPVVVGEDATTQHDTCSPSAFVEKAAGAKDVELDACADGGGGESVPNGEEIRELVCKTSQVEAGAHEQDVISFSGSTPAGEGSLSPSEVKEVGDQEGPGRCKTCGDAVTKRHVIQLYQEAARQQVEFRKAMSESREKNRQAMLDHRQAMLDEEKLAREYTQKEVKRMRTERSTLVVIELARAGKTVGEIKQMIDILRQVESRLGTDN